MLNTGPFSINEIAAWALPAGADELKLGLHVQLPALQRGSVWSTHKVEQLWDSLVRGFPIGCFILSEPRPHLLAKPFAPQINAHAPDRCTAAGHLLLDGQQRSTAIAVAFLNPWRNSEHSNAEFALWVDLEPPENSVQSDHAFRLLTRSHPWGYQRQDAKERLSTSARRQAMQEFKDSARAAGQEGLVFRPGHLPLAYAWPFDAHAPVPVSLIIEAIRSLPSGSDDIAIWNAVHKNVTTTLGVKLDWIVVEPNRTGARFEKGIQLRNLLSAPTRYMGSLLGGLRRLLESSNDQIRIPAQWLPSEHLAGASTDAGPSNREDSVLTLFVRINTEGIQPNGEELAYSILKSVMPECREGIEKLSQWFMPPPRMVLLLATLTLALISDRNEDTPPAFPDVGRFRRLVQGVDPEMPNFREALRAMLREGGTAQSVVGKAHKLLIVDPEKPDERPFRLLPLQAARMAQRNEHAFLLLFAWIYSRNGERGDWCGLDEAEHRRLVGLMCVLSWFHAPDSNTATNRRKFLARLWMRRKQLHSAGILVGLTEPAGADVGPILPLPPPKILAFAIGHCVVGHGFGGHDTKLWREWGLWANLQSRLGDVEETNNWYEKHVRWQNGGVEPETKLHATERRETAWHGLVARTIQNTELVLYAQRRFLSQSFPEFDPTSPTQLLDTEQPWDLDHIHPQNYVQGRGNIPPIIRAWHPTIGNLRAWPSEINRAHHDLDPGRKLTQPHPQETENYGLRTATDLRAASAVKNYDDWNLSHPGPDAGALVHYLRNDDADPRWQPNRQALIRAVTGRYVALYSTWYTELRVGELFLRQPS
jgi:Protein of unknown function DUF262